jgi:predicted XRE-type DNA-binding protein
MEAHSLPEALNLIMEQRDCSQNQLARELEKGQSWISNVIKGKAGLEFARVINILGRVGWEVVIRPKAEKSDDPVKRREFNKRTVAMGAASAVEAARSAVFIPSSTADPLQDPANVHGLAARLAIMKDEVGTAPVASIARYYINRIGSAINSRDRKLLTAASELVRQGALILVEERPFERVEQIGGLAYALARRSGDTDAQARALNTLSLICANYVSPFAGEQRGHGERAAMYAKKGLETPDLKPNDRAVLNMRLGRSLALIPGQEGQARKRLDQARHTEDLSTDECAVIAAGSGMAFARMGDYLESLPLLDEAIRLTGSWSPLEQCWALESKAKTALRASEPDLAAASMCALADVARLVESSPVEKGIKEILRLSAPRAGVPNVKEAREQLEEVAFSRGKVKLRE